MIFADAEDVEVGGGNNSARYERNIENALRYLERHNGIKNAVITQEQIVEVIFERGERRSCLSDITCLKTGITNPIKEATGFINMLDEARPYMIEFNVRSPFIKEPARGGRE